LDWMVGMVICRAYCAIGAPPISADSRKRFVTFETVIGETFGFGFGDSEHAEGFVREYTEHELAAAIENGVLEPSIFGRVITKQASWQGSLQDLDRLPVQFPERRLTYEIVSGWPTHALALFR
jgi:hypothetical protein